MKVLSIFIALLVQLSPTACNRSGTKTSSPAQSTPVTTTEAEKRLELTAIELHKVKLEYPHKVRDKDGPEKAYAEAWLVLLSFRNLPPAADMGMDLFIGDYRIPEYGGFKDGIYFRIYDEQLLQSLNGKEVSVSFAGEKMKSLNKKFSSDGYKKLSVEEESAVLKRPK